MRSEMKHPRYIIEGGKKKKKRTNNYRKSCCPNTTVRSHRRGREPETGSTSGQADKNPLLVGEKKERGGTKG